MVAPGDQVAFRVGVPRRKRAPSIMSSCTSVAVCNISTAAAMLTARSQLAPSALQTNKVTVGRIRLPPLLIRCVTARSTASCRSGSGSSIRSSTNASSSVTRSNPSLFNSISYIKKFDDVACRLFAKHLRVKAAQVSDGLGHIAHISRLVAPPAIRFRGQKGGVGF